MLIAFNVLNTNTYTWSLLIEELTTQGSDIVALLDSQQIIGLGCASLQTTCTFFIVNLTTGVGNAFYTFTYGTLSTAILDTQITFWYDQPNQLIYTMIY